MIPPLDPAFDNDNYEFKLTKFANTVNKFFAEEKALPGTMKAIEIKDIYYI